MLWVWANMESRPSLMPWQLTLASAWQPALVSWDLPRAWCSLWHPLTFQDSLLWWPLMERGAQNVKHSWKTKPLISNLGNLQLWLRKRNQGLQMTFWMLVMQILGEKNEKYLYLIHCVEGSEVDSVVPILKSGLLLQFQLNTKLSRNPRRTWKYWKIPRYDHAEGW